MRDHKIVITKLLPSIDKGPGHYIFNNSLLEDTIFVKNVRNIINDFKDSVDLFGSYPVLWDFANMAIISHAQDYSVNKSRERKQEYENALKMIEILEAIPKENLTNRMSTELEKYVKIETKYNDFKRAGIMLRAKLTNFEEN